MSTLKDHPIAELFPLMDDAEIDALAQDIKQNGQSLMITLYENKILDGRNRYRACMKARVEPKFKTYTGKHPLEYVIGLNLTRRHLTVSQRAMVAAKIADMRQGERTDKPENKGENEPSANLPKVAQAEAAKTMHVSTRSVTAAKEVLDKAPEKAKEIEAGKKTVHAAIKEIKDEAKPKSKTPALPKDQRGVTLPADKVALYNRRTEMTELADMVSKVRTTLKKAQDKNDPLYAHVNHSSTIAALDQAYAAIAGSTPYCVCPMCQGAGGRCCKKTGLLGKFQFKTFVPSELKKDDA